MLGWRVVDVRLWLGLWGSVTTIMSDEILIIPDLGPGF